MSLRLSAQKDFSRAYFHENVVLDFVWKTWSAKGSKVSLKCHFGGLLNLDNTVPLLPQLPSITASRLHKQLLLRLVRTVLQAGDSFTKKLHSICLQFHVKSILRAKVLRDKNLLGQTFSDEGPRSNFRTITHIYLCCCELKWFCGEAMCCNSANGNTRGPSWLYLGGPPHVKDWKSGAIASSACVQV